MHLAQGLWVYYIFLMKTDRRQIKGATWMIEKRNLQDADALIRDMRGQQRICKDLKDLKEENGESFKHYKNYIKYSFRLSSFWLNLEIKHSMYEAVWPRCSGAGFDSTPRLFAACHPDSLLSWHQKKFWRRQRRTFECCLWYNLVLERSVAASSCSLLAAGASPHGTR